MIKLLVLAFLMSIAVTSLGIIIASRMASMQSFQMVMNFLVMPLYFLSGAMFPMTSAPTWLKIADGDRPAHLRRRRDPQRRVLEHA